MTKKYTILVTLQDETPEVNGIYADVKQALIDAGLIALHAYQSGEWHDLTDESFEDAIDGGEGVLHDDSRTWLIDPESRSDRVLVKVVQIDGGLS